MKTSSMCAEFFDRKMGNQKKVNIDVQTLFEFIYWSLDYDEFCTRFYFVDR